MLRFPRTAPTAVEPAVVAESVRRLAELEVDEESREVRVDGAVVEGNLRLVEAHMSNLRRKLVAAGLNSPEIRTVRGVGYRLVA
jgi:DNA-binding winged helix-turn-helix (wHTH) protein